MTRDELIPDAKGGRGRPKGPQGVDRDALIEAAREFWLDDPRGFPVERDALYAVLADFALPLLTRERDAAYMAANKTAYERGLAHGRREAIEECAALVWQKRKLVEDFENGCRRKRDAAPPHGLLRDGIVGYSCANAWLSDACTAIRALARGEGQTEKPEAATGGARSTPGAGASPGTDLRPSSDADVLDRAAEILEADPEPKLWSLTTQNLRRAANQLRQSRPAPEADVFEKVAREWYDDGTKDGADPLGAKNLAALLRERFGPVVEALEKITAQGTKKGGVWSSTEAEDALARLKAAGGGT